jgi:hypothetical protein
LRGTANRRPFIPIFPGHLLPAAMALLVGLLYAFFGPLWNESHLLWLSGILLAALFIYLAVRLHGERAALRRLALGILHAREDA